MVTDTKNTKIRPDIIEHDVDSNLLINRNTGEVISEISPYLDYIDKPHNFQLKKDSYKALNGNISCLAGYVKGKCSNGHTFAKAIFCGKEWCADCGEKNSMIHQRRVARWWDKVHSFKTLGYLVVTIPMEARPDFYDKSTLSAYRTAIKRWLSEEKGYKQGLTRWHWLGDCKKCNGEGCEHCNGKGVSKKFNPHLNIFIEEGKMDKVKFNYIIGGLKEFCAKWIRNNLHVELKNNVVVHYQYTSEPAKMTHLLKYVTRATLRHDSLYKIRKTVYKYRASTTWGKFEKPEQPATDAGTKLENGKCPCCDEKVHWIGFESLRYVELGHVDEIEVLSMGYLRLADSKPPKKLHPFKLINYN